jgi:16S rRNA (guanine(527)-N(7))-methyltransferase RsmG
VAVGVPDNPPEGHVVSRETTATEQRPLTAGDFRALTGASPNQIERLSAYLTLLRRWQSHINLVGASTLADPWRRHVLDSAQLGPLLPPGEQRIVDLGSGAGFPGLVLAIMTNARVRLVESDARKCAFLFEAARVMEVQVEIDNARSESLPCAIGDVVTARAFAPLAELLEHAYKLLTVNGCCLFLKGRNWRAELTRAEQSWKMRATPIQSRSDPTGVVLEIDDLSRRNQA